MASAAGLREAPPLEVWSEPAFAISEAAERLAETDKLSHNANSTHVNESPIRTLQVALMVFNTKKNVLGACESKLGFGCDDSDEKRSMLRNLCSTRMLLKSCGETRGSKPSDVVARMNFYCGQCSLSEP